MKKKFFLEIKTPCEASVNDMTKINDGFHCGLCAKNVIDLSNKTNSEIAEFIAKNKNKNNICARLKTSQLEQTFEYDTYSKSANFKYAVAVAASVLLTSNVVAQEKDGIKTEVNPVKNRPEIMGKIAIQPQQTLLKFVIEGRLLDHRTLKPLSEKDFPNLTIRILNSSLEGAKVKPNSGDFGLPVSLEKNTKTVTFLISGDDFNYSITKPIDLTKIKNGKLSFDITVNTTKFEKVYMLGGIGVNYIDNEKKQ